MNKDIAATQAIILTKIPFAKIIFNRFLKRNQKTIYFYDLYSKSHSIMICLLIRSIGRETISRIITKASQWCGVIIQKVPHANEIKDYHLIQIKAQSDIVRYIDVFYERGDYINNNAVSKCLHDKTCRDSIFIKDVANRVWHILENIRVVKALGYQDINLWVAKDEFPFNLIKLIEHGEKVQVKFLDFILNRILFIPAMILILLIEFLSHFFKVLRKYERAHLTDNGYKKIAVEFVDPWCNTGDGTHPNFLSKNKDANNLLLTYVRSNRKKFFRREEFKLAESIPVIFLDKLPYFFSDLKCVLRGYYYLLKDSMLNNNAIYYIVCQLQYFRLFLEFSSLFRCYHIGIHLYNILANGRFVGLRFDSGLITDLARKFEIYSISYQSRVSYHPDYKLLYDVFDEFCIWGRAWEEYFRRKEFIMAFKIIGNVFLDENMCWTLTVPTSGHQKISKIIIFLTDMEKGVPQHHSLDYVERFLIEMIYAASHYWQRLGQEEKILYIKIKDLEHFSVLSNHANIKKALELTSIKLHVYKHIRHNVKNILKEEGKFISIGFTMPGMDALLLGKSSIYFTPYYYSYNNIFSIHSPLIVHNRDEIETFLEHGNSFAKNYLEKLDPFRDGKASERLFKICIDQLTHK